MAMVVSARQRKASATPRQRNVELAELTAKARKKLKTSQFAVKGKRAYPINDKAHAQNALARVSQHGSPAEKAKVKAAVARKYPSMGKKSTSKKGGK